MANLNYTSATIGGRITKDLEIKEVGENKVVNFSVAVNKGRGDKQKAYFYDIRCWNKTAEFVSKYFHKGSCILVDGDLLIDEYTDKNGVTVRKPMIDAKNVYFVDSAEKNDAPLPF